MTVCPPVWTSSVSGFPTPGCDSLVLQSFSVRREWSVKEVEVVVPYFVMMSRMA